MPLKTPCRGRTLKRCKQAPRSCKYVKRSSAKSYCRKSRKVARTRRVR